MEEPIILIHSLDYLFLGLEAAEVMKMDLVNEVRMEADRLNELKTKLTRIREIVKINKENSQKLAQFYEKDQNLMPLVAKFVTTLTELDEISSCKTITEMMRVIERITQCMIQIQIQLTQ